MEISSHGLKVGFLLLVTLTIACDAISPTIICPSSTVITAQNNGYRSASVSFAVTCEDNLDGDIPPTCNATSDDTQFWVGETTVTCSCTDQSGNTNQCSFGVTVSDDTPPFITCPSNTVAVARNQGHTTATVDFVATCQDNVDVNISPTCTRRSGVTQFSVGDTTVSCSCRDQAGNTNQCSFIVTVTDDTPPVITCPRNTSVVARNQGHTTATVDFAATCEDNVDGNISPTCTKRSGVTQFPMGDTTVNCSCRDQADNSNQCSFIVTVTDKRRPRITCPSNKVAAAQNKDYSSATVTFVATCEDNVDGDITPNCNATSDVTQFSVGNTTVTCSCTDQSSNTKRCSFRVTVTDKRRPRITCPSNIVAAVQNEDYTYATVNFVATCEDNVDGIITPNCNATSYSTQFSVGNTTVTCSCTDQSANTRRCSFHVTVTDDTPPVITCPRNKKAVARNQGHTTATVDFVATCQDNVDGNIRTTCTAISGVTHFFVGDTTVSCLCRDQAGNTNQCSFIVTVTDKRRPRITCPSNIVAAVQNEDYTYATVNFVATCEDNVDGTITPNCNAISNVTQFSVGTTTVTCSCTDQSANTRRCSFHVTVICVT